MEENEKSLTKIKLGMIGSALIVIAIGVFFIVKPELVIKGLCYGVGGLLTAFGLVKLIRFFINGLFSSSYDLVTGGVFLIIGVFFILYPETIREIIKTGIGILIVADGMLTLRNALIAYKQNLKNWYITLILALVTIIGGCVLLFFANSEKITMFAGIALIVDGAFDIASFVLFIIGAKQGKTIVETTVIEDGNTKVVETKIVTKEKEHNEEVKEEKTKEEPKEDNQSEETAKDKPEVKIAEVDDTTKTETAESETSTENTEEEKQVDGNKE